MPKAIDETVIFSAALDLLVAHGYEGATTQRIAETAGVNEATLFRKYGSKVGLFEKAIDHLFSETPLNRLVYSGELEADLLAIVKAYIATNATHGDIFPILLIEASRNADLQSTFAAPWKNIQTIIEIIQQYQIQGMLRNESPLLSLGALIGPIMVMGMVRRSTLNLPLPAIDPLTFVGSFLHGRKQ